MLYTLDPFPTNHSGMFTIINSSRIKYTAEKIREIGIGVFVTANKIPEKTITVIGINGEGLPVLVLTPTNNIEQMPSRIIDKRSIFILKLLIQKNEIKTRIVRIL